MTTIEALAKEVAELRKEIAELRKAKPAKREKRAPSEYNKFMADFAKKHKDSIPANEMFNRGAEEWRKRKGA